MTTGPEMYKIVKDAIQPLDVGSDFRIHPLDAMNLMKLKPSELVSFGYEQTIAEEVSSALFVQDYDPLSRTLGVRLIIDQDEERLIDD